MTEVLVIGGGVSGLVAAIYLARAGQSVTVLESTEQFGGTCANRVPVGSLGFPTGPHLFAALDPRVIKELKLGIDYLDRDLPLIGLRSDGPPLVLPRDIHDARRSLAPLSERDAGRFADFRREHYAFARTMRAVWWDQGSISDARARATLRKLQVTAATTWLDAAFETDALRAAFAFDALAAGLSPSAAGSALLFAWRAAQELCGLQGAVALPAGGPALLVESLVRSAQAAGVILRTGVKVERLDSDGERVRGVILADGEGMSATAVLSSLSRRQTLIDFLPPGTAGFAMARHLAKPQAVGEAKVLLGLNSLPTLFEQSGRYVIADRLESAPLAHAEARAGHIPSDIALEVVPLPTGTIPPIVLSIMVRPVPVEPVGGWKEQATRLVQSVLRTLEGHIPNFLSLIGGLAFAPPAKRDPFDTMATVSPWRARIETPLKGLYLCGEAAEPVPCLSGRAGRIAAAIVSRDLEAKP